jgi:hypothetical protein
MRAWSYMSSHYTSNPVTTQNLFSSFCGMTFGWDSRERDGIVAYKHTLHPSNIKTWTRLWLGLMHHKRLAYTNVGFLKLIPVSKQLNSSTPGNFGWMRSMLCKEDFSLLGFKDSCNFMVTSLDYKVSGCFSVFFLNGRLYLVGEW